jgi:DNA-binding CsgD family transcriptional regulator
LSVTAVSALLERDESLSALARLLAEVRSSSEGRLVFVGGEAGVGKTAVLRAFCETQPTSVRVLWGECEPLLTPRALGPLMDVAEACGGELVELTGSGARPYEVASALVGELRRRAPTVLVLEDVHWADEATLDVLALLGRRARGAPALVLASFRDDELGRAQQLRTVLGELAGRTVRLKVAPLSPQAVGELARPAGVDAQELYRKTGGNPFFVTEALAAGESLMPDTVRDAVLARAARLGAGARQLLQAVSIIPGRVEMWLLEAIAGELVERVEECLASGMLMRADSGVAFRHELARVAVEESVRPDRRLALHRAALASLTAPPFGEADPERLTHHSEAIEDGEGVLRWAPQAAVRAAAGGAHREAAAQYARALRFAERLGPEQRAELLERRSYECYLTRRFDQAIEALELALAVRRELGEQVRVGDLMSSLARALHMSGRAPEASKLAGDAVALLEPLGANTELARAYATRSQISMVLGEVDSTLAWGERAIELAERLGETETLVHALNSVGSGMLLAGHLEGEEKLERSLRLAKQARLDGDAGRAFNNLVAKGLALRDYALAERYLQDGIAYCEERGLDTWREQLLANRMTFDQDRGRWAQAVDTATELLANPGCQVHPRIEALVTIGRVRARYGDPQVWEPLEEALALARPTGQLQADGMVAAARAEAAWLQGRPQEVPRATDEALMLALKHGAPWYVGELACWRRRAGIRDRLPGGSAAEPYALSLAGDWARASELWDEIGSPYEAALALADSDDHDALRQALAQLQALGARAAAAIVSRRLRKRGVRGLPRGPRPRTRENPAGLTARELEVLSLLAEGMRNAEVAERLVLSEKTVDHHVSAILRKLDVRTRSEAAVKAAQLGLTERA